MSKVTSKLQITVPRAVADALGIKPGDEIDWIPGEGSVRIVRVAPRRAKTAPSDDKRRVRLFDQATERQRERERSRKAPPRASSRGWSREELYDRDRTR